MNTLNKHARDVDGPLSLKREKVGVRAENLTIGDHR